MCCHAMRPPINTPPTYLRSLVCSTPDNIDISTMGLASKSVKTAQRVYSTRLPCGVRLTRASAIAGLHNGRGASRSNATNVKHAYTMSSGTAKPAETIVVG